MKKFLLIMFFAVSLTVAQAGELKIAVVNADQLFQKYYKTKIVDASLKQQMQVYKAWLKKLNSSNAKLQEEFKILRDDAQNIALDTKERERKRLEAMRKYQQIREKKVEIEQYSAEKMRQFKQLEEKKRMDILTDIKKAVSSRAALEGYSLVIDLSGKTLNGISSVLYHKADMDITQVILKDLNRGRQGKNKLQ
jgi:outer membrane protein